MQIINLKFATALASLGVALAGSGFLAQVVGDQPESALSPEQFARVRALIKPQAGEAKWLDIPWEIDVWRARKRAAAEGKPIFFLTGGGRSPLGDC
jgi:hypothetical protein